MCVRKLFGTGSQLDVGVMACRAGSRGLPWFRDAREAWERRRGWEGRGGQLPALNVSAPFRKGWGLGVKGKGGCLRGPLGSLSLPPPHGFRSNPGGGVLQGWRMEWAAAPAVRALAQRTSGRQLPEPTTSRPAAGWAGGPTACVRPQWPTRISLLPSGSQGFMGKGGVRSNLLGARVVSRPKTAWCPLTSARNPGCSLPTLGSQGGLARKPCPTPFPSPVSPKQRKHRGRCPWSGLFNALGGPSAGHSLWGSSELARNPGSVQSKGTRFRF